MLSVKSSQIDQEPCEIADRVWEGFRWEGVVKKREKVNVRGLILKRGRREEAGCLLAIPAGWFRIERGRA